MHPARDVLEAFGLGKLDDPSSEQVSRHLDACPDCQRQVAELPADSLLEHLRQANAAGLTPAPGKSLSPLTQSVEWQPPSSGADAAVPPELADNAQYEILRPIGAGGMGVVYLARNKWLDRLEVIKVIGTGLVGKAGVLERFLREIRAAAALSHENVVKAYSATQFGDLLVFAMEYVAGEDLAKVVQKRGPLPIADACAYARQVALGLQHAHEKGMVHRDIKPSNLILARGDGEEVVKILDFGLAKASSEKGLQRGLTAEGHVLGTPDYIAPEQITSAASADIRADIYSLGCTLYYLLTGSTPFHADNVFLLLQAHLTTIAQPVNLRRPQVSGELAAVVARMMAKDPAERYQKPLEVAQALAPFCTVPDTLPDRAQAGARDRKRLLPRRVAATATAIVLLGLLALGIGIWFDPPLPTTPKNDGNAIDASLPATFKNAFGMEFVLVGKGTAWLGGGAGEQGKQVAIAHDFYLGVYEVTQEEWQAVTGVNPSAFARTGGDQASVKDIPEAELKRFPVEWVSWDDAQAFLKRLNTRKKDGWTHRLPTAAEWEYACRGGPRADRFDGAFDFYFEKPAQKLLPAQANFGNVLKRTCKVGSYLPNRLGLYDMHGNVAEWCDDAHRAREGVLQRVVRGGAFDDSADICRAAFGGADPPDTHRTWTGLRVAFVPSGKE